MATIDFRPWLPAVLLAWGTLSPAALPAAVQQVFSVSPDGDDRNPGTEARPLATLDRAKQAVRQVNRTMSGDILVVLRSGTYRLDRTLVFEPDDSGTGGHRVIYKCQPGASPVLSGGRRIAGRQPDRNGRWKARTDLDNFRQLYVNGRRAIRARGGPPAGLVRLGDEGFPSEEANGGGTIQTSGTSLILRTSIACGFVLVHSLDLPL